MAGLGAPELLIILVVVLVLFGGAKLPKLARSLGQAQKEFRSGQDEPAPERADVVPPPTALPPVPPRPDGRAADGVGPVDRSEHTRPETPPRS